MQFERSYDSFHEQAENIYRVPIEYSQGFGAFPRTAANHPGLGPAMLTDFPEVAQYTRIFNPSNMGFNLALSYTNAAGKRIFTAEEQIFAADSTFFSVFSFPFISGNPTSALNEPNSIVLSTSLAKKYFGNEDPMGKLLTLYGRTIKVTGVYQDIPGNSHLKFDGLLSFKSLLNRIGDNNLWIWPEFYTYVVLKPNANPKAVEAKFPAFSEKYLAEIHKEHGFKTYFSLQPLLDIHLKSECANEPTPPGDDKIVYFLSLLALFILIIAWVNYINLSTSKSIERAKEVGMRKVVGAQKGQLIGQFLTEAILLNGMGILLGFCMAYLCLPAFTSIVGKNIGNDLINITLLGTPYFWLVFFSAAFLGGVIAGFYPSIVLSSFRPIQVLKGHFHKSNNTLVFRKALVGFQFVLSIILIAATLLVTQQLNFMNQKDLGYTKDQILIVKAPIIRDSISWMKSKTFNTALSKFPVIKHLAKSSDIPGKLLSMRMEGRKEGQEKTDNLSMYYQSIDDQYLKTFDIPLIAGRNLKETDSENGEERKVLVNEILAKQFGFENPEAAINQVITYKLGQSERKATIVGVVKNYHQRSLKEAYDPTFYFHNYGWKYYALNINTDNWSEVITKIEGKHKEILPNTAFDYFFLDEFFDRQYRADQQFGAVCQMISGLAIFVACLGFFGLSTLMLVQRTKEIGIRKILGASPPGILILISKDFIQMLVLANIIAIPFIIYFGNQWLNNFAFNTGLNWPIFVLPILSLLLIVFMIIGIQLYRTTTINPIHALRNE